MVMPPALLGYALCSNMRTEFAIGIGSAVFFFTDKWARKNDALRNQSKPAYPADVTATLNLVAVSFLGGIVAVPFVTSVLGFLRS